MSPSFFREFAADPRTRVIEADLEYLFNLREHIVGSPHWQCGRDGNRLRQVAVPENPNPGDGGLRPVAWNPHQHLDAASLDQLLAPHFPHIPVIDHA